MARRSGAEHTALSAAPPQPANRQGLLSRSVCLTRLNTNWKNRSYLNPARIPLRRSPLAKVIPTLNGATSPSMPVATDIGRSERGPHCLSPLPWRLTVGRFRFANDPPLPFGSIWQATSSGRPAALNGKPDVLPHLLGRRIAEHARYAGRQKENPARTPYSRGAP